MSLSLPKISIVTPSFNQAAFLGDAMDSVLQQDYPGLEYVLMDGGSTDGSMEMIRERQGHLASWTSGPDGGHYTALNTGFAQTSGEVMGWLNSDDKYLPWTLSVVGEIFAQFPEVEWLTTLFPLRWDARGRAVRCSQRSGYSREAFMAGEHLPAGHWRYEGWVQQESTFWRRSLWDRAGCALDTRWKLAGDFELWARFHRHAKLYAVDTPLGGFRLHGEQKTSLQKALYHEEAEAILKLYGGAIPGRLAALGRSLALHCPKALHGVCGALGLRYPAALCLRERGDAGWALTSALH